MGRAPLAKDNRNNVGIGLRRNNRKNPKSPTAQVDRSRQYDDGLVNKLTGRKAETVYRNGPHNEMGKDEFLKLLSHQLRNQDPMNPMDQNKFAADLAQFAQLEQLSNMNTKFDKLNPNVGVEDKFYGASFLGKKVVTSGNTVNYKGNGEKAEIYFNLEKPAAKAVVRVLDKQGNIITEQWKEKLSAGAHQSVWDGDDLAGNPENAGEYRIAIQAWDETGGLIPAQTKVEGIVESVLFENGESLFIVDGKKVFLRDIESFHMPKSQAKNEVAKKMPQQAINTYKNNAPLDQGEKSVYDN